MPIRLSLSVVLLMISIGCSDSSETDNSTDPLEYQNNSLTEPRSLYPEKKIVLLNLEQGFRLNQNTADSIIPILTESGDTLKTGQLLAITPKSIENDSLLAPIKSKVGDFSNLEKHNAFPNLFNIEETITKIPLHIDSILAIPLGEGPQDHLLVNSLGDTLQTGEPIKTQGKELPISFPIMQEALSPSYRENRSLPIQFLDVDQGLPASYIRSSIQDSQGNLWFGTFGGGVTKYDGTNFFTLTEKSGLSNNNVYAILEDTEGNFWFGTEGGGINKYNGYKVVHYGEEQGFGSNEFYTIIQDKHGDIWFGSYQGGLTQFDGESFIHYTEKEGLSINNLRAICEDEKGNLWIGTEGGGVNLFDRKAKTFSHITTENGLPHDIVYSIIEDKQGNMWFGTKGGTTKYDGKSLINFTTNHGLKDNNTYSLLEDKSGNIWMTSIGGAVSKYNGRTIVNYTEDQGLTNNLVLTSLEDNAGNLWFGTYGGGINKLDPVSQGFNQISEKEGLSFDVVLSMMQDKSDRIWFGTYGGGISIYENGFFKHLSEENGLKDRTILSLFEDSKGNIWFGTYLHGVTKYDGHSFFHFNQEQGLSHSNILDIEEDKNGDLWFASEGGGITRYTGEEFFHYTKKQGLSDNFISSITKDQKGDLWFGTYEAGAIKYLIDQDEFIFYTEKEGLSSNVIYSIAIAADGAIWMGSKRGLIKFDNEEFQYFNEDNGLTNNVIRSITIDSNENLWASTQNGINQLRFSENGEKIIAYSKIDGLKGLDFYPNSNLLDKDDQIWWGSGKGLEKINSKKFRNSTFAPLTHLNTIGINGQKYDFHNFPDSLRDQINFSKAERFFNYPLELKLDHEYSHLSFYFSATDWSAQHKIKYTYRIPQLNKKWSEPSKETKADFTNLSHGDYIFELKAIGQSGEWSNTLSYSFRIKTPWWHTWWARSFYILIGITLIILVIRLRTAKLKAKQIELEHKIELATHEITEQHNEIMDSIAYAKRIQTAILPPPRIVKENLKNSFILYKPKDVVAGDFYWMEQKNGDTLFAAADCTGHGVPGALVSVICNNALNRAVREFNLVDPGKILDKSREIVIQEFEKSDEVVKDGMDIALCSLNGMNLKYAGANNPLWIIRNGEIIETKADKQPIGQFDNPQPYTTNEFKLQSGDTFYVFSDGLVDQFGGDKGKKFKAKAFRELLVSIQDKSLQEQKTIINEVFENWKGSIEQIDDICVIGVRV